jgi:integrase
MGVRLAQHHGSWVLRFNVNRWRKTHALGPIEQVPKRVAMQALEIARAELALGTPPLALSIFRRTQAAETGYTVAQAFDDFVAHSRRFRLRRETTLTHYEQAFDSWVRESRLGRLPIARVTRDDILTVLAQIIDKGNKKSGVPTRVLAVVRLLLNWLIHSGKLVDDHGRPLPNPAATLGRDLQERFGAQTVPVDEIDAVADTQSEDVVRPFARAEQTALIQVLRRRGPKHAAFALVGLRAGLRFGEIAGLRLTDVDLKGRTISVERTVVLIKGKGLHWSPPKTRAGVRVVPILSEELAEALRVHIQQRREENLRRGWTQKAKAWLFVNDAGGPVYRTNWQDDHWRPALREVGLSGHPFHDTRHTFATEFYTLTRDLERLRALLGHSDIQTTANVYVHWVRGAAQADATRHPTLLDAPSDARAAGS